MKNSQRIFMEPSVPRCQFFAFSHFSANEREKRDSVSRAELTICSGSGTAIYLTIKQERLGFVMPSKGRAPQTDPPEKPSLSIWWDVYGLMGSSVSVRMFKTSHFKPKAASQLSERETTSRGVTLVWIEELGSLSSGRPERSPADRDDYEGLAGGKYHTWAGGNISALLSHSTQLSSGLLFYWTVGLQVRPKYERIQTFIMPQTVWMEAVLNILLYMRRLKLSRVNSASPSTVIQSSFVSRRSKFKPFPLQWPPPSHDSPIHSHSRSV